MTDNASPRDIASTLEPQLPGRRAARDISEALVEPVWDGLHVVAALAGDSAALFAHGDEVALPDDLLAALRDAFGADDAVIEGYLTTKALANVEEIVPPAPKVEAPSLIIPKGLFKQRSRDDPYFRPREHVRRALATEPAILEALATGEPHAFVATDLLWLDGQSLLDVPLLERKRLLETVLAESLLVRVTAFVRASAARTLSSWKWLGFAELSYRAANSRYLPGRENPDWAIIRPT